MSEITTVQRPVLPFPNLVQHGIGDAADQVGRDPLNRPGFTGEFLVQ
ncbi:hypothetical protein [Paracoccus yeei]